MLKWFQQTRGGPAPWGLLGMLVLVTLVESYVVRRDLDFTTRTDFDWKQTAFAASHRAAKAEILCFGDSQVKFGVQPKLLEERLGRSSYSLALYGGGPPSSYFLLRRALEAGAKPAAVLVNFEQGAMLADHLHHVHPRHWSELLDARDCLDVARTYGEANLFASLLTSHILPSYRARFELRSNIVASLKGQSTSTRHDNVIHRRNWKVNHGAEVNTRSSGYGGDVPEGYRVLVDNWTPIPVNAAYARRFFRLAARHHIRVFWLMQPYVPAYQRMREDRGMDRHYEAFARSLLTTFPNVEVIDSRRSGFEPSVFLDPVHLDRRGAAVETESIAAILHDRLAVPAGGPRWHLLPAYRDRPADSDLEDAFQSWVLVDKAAAGTLRR